MITEQQLKEARNILKWKDRKLWNDNDQHMVTRYNTSFGWPLTKQSFLGWQIGPHRGLGNHLVQNPSPSQLTTYVLNMRSMSYSTSRFAITIPNVDWTGEHPRYGSIVNGEMIPDQDGYVDVTKTLYDQFGQDGLDIVTEFANNNNLEIFAGFRFNDRHDATDAYADLLPARKYFWDNGGLLQNGENNGYDYSNQEVRDSLLALITAIVQNVPVTGIHIDFWRHLGFFKNQSSARAEQDRYLTTPAQIQTITDLMSDIRDVVNQQSIIRMENGQDPLLISVKVPDSQRYCKEFALDVSYWMEQDLIDLLVVGGYSRMDRIDNVVDWVHRHNVPVYLSVEEQRVTGRPDSSSLGWRGYSRNALLNSDGAFIFNRDYAIDTNSEFGPSGTFWREFGDLDTSTGRDRIYYLTYTGGNKSNPGTQSYYPVGFFPDFSPVLTPEYPKSVGVFSSYLEIGERDGDYSQATIIVVTDSSTGVLNINGVGVQSTSHQEGIQFDVYGLINSGVNKITIEFTSLTEISDVKVIVSP